MTSLISVKFFNKLVMQFNISKCIHLFFGHSLSMSIDLLLLATVIIVSLCSGNKVGQNSNSCSLFPDATPTVIVSVHCCSTPKHESKRFARKVFCFAPPLHLEVHDNSGHLTLSPNSGRVVFMVHWIILTALLLPEPFPENFVRGGGGGSCQSDLSESRKHARGPTRKDFANFRNTSYRFCG